MNDSSAPEFNAEIALEIIRKYHKLDEVTLEKECDEDLPYDEDKINAYLGLSKDKVPRSNRKDYYLVPDSDSKKELVRALNYMFENGAVHHKKRIRIGNEDDEDSED